MQPRVVTGVAGRLASGAGASQALAVAISVGALGVLTGAVTLLFAVAWRTATELWSNLH